MKNKRAWAVGAVLMALALGGAVLSIRQDWTGADAARPVPSTVETSAPSVAAPPRPSLPSSSASAPDPALASASPADTLSPRARRMRDDWCGYGVSEAFNDNVAEITARKKDEEYRPTTHDADRVIKQASDDVKAEWVRTLRARSDVRSQAIADYLADDAPAHAHLQDLARRSTDPMVTALALWRPCTGGCTNVDAAQWSRLEPDNVSAWMAQLQQRKPSQELQSYVIGRVMLARRNDDYTATLAQELASLAQTKTPGLRQAAELNVMIGTKASVSTISMLPLRNACRARTAPATPAACEALALAMWDSPSLLQRGMALSMAAHAVPAGSPQRAAWEQRALEYDVTYEAYKDHVERENELMVAAPPQFRCEVNDVMHQYVKAMHTGGEWNLARWWILANPLTPEALAERARAQRGGKSQLDDIGKSGATPSPSSP